MEPIIGIQGIDALGKDKGIGTLKVPKCGTGLIITIATIVVVVGGNLS
jgi:hypothetical protein